MMASHEPLVNGTCSRGISTASFFKVGEIRAPQESDFAYFLQLAEDHSEWTMKYDKGNITVWMKETPGVTLKMLKVLATFENISAEVLYDTLQDSEYRSNWDEAILDDHVICSLEGSDSDICYYSMKCPTPLRNRDFVYQRCWRVTDKEYISFNHSVAHELFPPTKRFIRGISQLTGFVIREQNEGCTACYLTHSDPRGQIPKWLLNILACKIAPRVFQKISRAAESYTEWKSRNNPDYRPWIYYEQYGSPIVPISSLKQFSEDDIPLTPTKVELDYLEQEAELEDTEIAPVGVVKLDPLIFENGMDLNQKQEGTCTVLS